MLNNRKKIVILNANTALFVHEAEDNAVDNIITTEEKKKSSKVSQKIEKDVSELHNNKSDKVENENK